MRQLLSSPELALFYLGLLLFLLASLVVWASLLRKKSYDNTVFILAVIGVVAFAATITIRWQNTGNGPFLTLYEVLLSNLFSLGLIFTIVFQWIKPSRSSALLILPFLTMMAFWAGTESKGSLQLPATYDTALLWVHVGVGKVFLAMCLIATGLSSAMFLRHVSESHLFNMYPPTDQLDNLMWRCMAIAFVFQSLMLIAGAVWAQDAWGRFWAWDSLETWAFITWLFLGLSMHARLTWKLPVWSGWLMIFVVFILAMLTFFGIPFTSIGPHKGIM